MVKIDFGCGKNKREGFFGVDVLAFEDVDFRFNAGKDPFPWEDETVEEAHTSHFLEHLEAMERVHFFNELYRVLKPGAIVTVITPNWASCRAYGDVTHKWPPVSEFFYPYLSKDWRATNAPHNDFYTCDFDATWGYNMAPSLAGRSDEYRRFALENYKEAASDLYATLTKR